MTRTGLSPLAWLDDVAVERRAAGLRRSLKARTPVGADLDLASSIRACSTAESRP